jgi:hypothetical protein
LVSFWRSMTTLNSSVALARHPRRIWCYSVSDSLSSSTISSRSSLKSAGISNEFVFALFIILQRILDLTRSYDIHRLQQQRHIPDMHTHREEKKNSKARQLKRKTTQRSSDSHVQIRAMSEKVD